VVRDWYILAKRLTKSSNGGFFLQLAAKAHKQLEGEVNALLQSLKSFASAIPKA
jgi:hypothetical protein